MSSLSGLQILEKNLLRDEVKKLNAKETSILSKAKQIESEMEKLKDQKAELLVNLYKEQLVADSE